MLTGVNMLQSCARLLRGGTALCHLSRPIQPACSELYHFSVSQECTSEITRDYGFPNPTWSQNLLDLYMRFVEMSKDGSWKQIPSYNATVHHIEGKPPKSNRERRLFTRNLDKDGVGFEYTMFYNKAERRMVCLFQPGPYLEGPPGFTHGGCIATIIDSTAGAGAVYHSGSVMTANLNVNYRNPIPLGSTVIVDSHVDKVEGKKVYTSCEVRSHDDSVLHTEASGVNMLQRCAMSLCRGAALCHLSSRIPRACFMPCHFSMSRVSDYGLPNPTWGQNLLDLYNTFLEQSKNGSWRPIPCYGEIIYSIEGDPPEGGRVNRFFTRNFDKDGVGFEYSMFYNKDEKRVVCLLQPGTYLGGHPGFIHGGCIATIIDDTSGIAAVLEIGKVMTAQITINYRNPIPLGSTVIVDSHVDKVEGKKVYTSCEVRSHDDSVLHTEAKALFIRMNQGDMDWEKFAYMRDQPEASNL
ncbi:uncharacterized protein WCC33_017875 [Rhinophrynus dorsalis]